MKEIFDKFQSIKVLVIGDFMVDKYTIGSVERISPEAPVPILNVKEKFSKAGGAGNVVLNLLALGAKVTAFGRVGDDEEGADLKRMIKGAGAKDCLYVEKGFPTCVKNRIIASSQQVIRIDSEKNTETSSDVKMQIFSNLAKIIKDQDIIAISDYGKGLLSDDILEKIIEIAEINNVPVLVDPKGRDFSKYKNATTIKPNLSEAYIAANMTSESSIEDVAKRLHSITKAKNVLITRSEKGISYFNFENDFIRKDYPCISKEVKDVTGAGDTVLALTALCFASNVEMDKTLFLSNVAAGIAIEHIGCARVTSDDLLKRIKELNHEKSCSLI